MARLAFGGFELDPSSGELRKGEDCIHIQEQPLRLLLCLLERPGQLVGRDELQKRMWSGEVHVDFEDGLNAAAWRLRQALGDSAERPTFIETVPRKGYRFVGKVLPLPGNGPPPSGSFPMPVYRPDSDPRIPAARSRPRIRPLFGGRILALAAGLAMAGGAAGLWFLVRPDPAVVELAPLVNGTGDPAVDYFASALSHQVGGDLRSAHGLKVVAPAGTGPVGAAAPTGGLKVQWILLRTSQGYRIEVALADREGRLREQAVFQATPDDLHEVHGKIAAFVAARAGPGRSATR